MIHRLIAVLLLASVGAASGADLPKPVVVEEGVRQGGAGPVKFSVSLAEQVPPGTWVVYNFAKYGDVPGTGAVSIEYYYAGISQATIHVFRITEKDGRETDRRPILLPLNTNGIAVLHVRPQEGRTLAVKLQRGGDGTVLSASVMK